MSEQPADDLPALAERWTTRPVASFGREVVFQTPAAAHVSWDLVDFDWIVLLRCGHVIPCNGEISAARRIPCERCTDGEPPLPLPEHGAMWLGIEVDRTLSSAEDD